jgi:hypothetical protein
MNKPSLLMRNEKDKPSLLMHNEKDTPSLLMRHEMDYYIRTVTPLHP